MAAPNEQFSEVNSYSSCVLIQTNEQLGQTEWPSPSQNTKSLNKKRVETFARLPPKCCLDLELI